MLEKDARNFLERIPYQYINIRRRDWSGKEVNGEGGSDETTVLRCRGSAGNLALTVLEGSVDGLRHQGRPKRQWMDDKKSGVVVATFS